MRVCRCRIPGSLLAALLVTLSACLFSPPSAVSADDTEAPKLTSLRFSPASIDTSKGPAEVTISFTASDDSSGVAYLETGFVDPSGTSRRPGSVKLAPTLSATHSLRIIFPRFSPPGTWTLAQVFLADSAGNTLILDSDALRGGGFPTSLQVISAQDTVSPKLTALDFAPARIDTSVGPADVKVNFTATDDLSGVNYVELSFVSPSGVARHGGSAKSEVAQSLSNSVTVTFPRLSEAGQWTLGAVFLSDAAGNTLVLDTARISELGFRTTLAVKSASDTISPSLTALRFTPAAIDTSQGPATVNVEFTATDNLSGVASVEVSLVSPSGSWRQNGSRTFSPAHEVTDSVQVSFPRSSEPGTWTLGSVFLADAAGNTLVLDGAGVSGRGPTTLDVKSRSDTISPNLTALRFTPEAIDTTQGPVAVKVEFTATDNFSGVTSFEVVFVSPSDTAKANGAAKFSPAHEVTDAVAVSFPKSSEPGAWRVGSVMVADAAGNTLLLNADEAASKGARTLQVR